ncbi:SDR family oxidoreductase [Selenomonadales bacterium OttesenSCG-928-I06]|nr:SDR family oxidoreductase [Selenomonadales bacterium OttesenSCG-928-I06]
MRFADKVIYITQAYGKVGEALAIKFASEGADLVLGFAESLLIQQVKKLGAEVLVVTPDLTHYDGVEILIKEIKAVFPRIDILIFNNSKIAKTSIETLDKKSFKEQLSYNAKAAFIATRYFGKDMRINGGGSIIYISSIHVDKPTASTPLYSIAQSCINMLNKEASLFYGKDSINCNIIEVGALEGDEEVFTSNLIKRYNDFNKYIPRSKAGKPEEVANIAAFLASSDASFINGASIRADGGFILRYK